MASSFETALLKGQVFEFLTGQMDYEIRFDWAYMPTDTTAVTYQIATHLRGAQLNEAPEVTEAMMRLSQEPEWAWLVVYYCADFLHHGLNFLPVAELYANLTHLREPLASNSGWIVFNYKGVYDNLWDVVVAENARFTKEMGVDLPPLA